MKLKQIAALFGAVIPVFASGCSFSEFSFEDALRPPKAMGDEAEIEKLISGSVTGGYTFKYPKSGNYRSAIIMNDLDGDDTQEAIAFFRGKEEIANVHMLVMKEQDGQWQIAGDFITETTDVDCVDFADIDNSDGLEILVGYTTYTPNVNFLSCYAYQGNSVTAIQSGQNYSSFYCGSIDSGGKSQVITLSLFNVDTEASATMLEYSERKNALYAKSSVAMDPNVVKYKNVVFSDFAGGTKGIVVDGAFASEETVTQIIYYNTELSVLRNPLYKDKTKNITQRSCSVVSADIDNDLNIEIPVVEKMPYSGADAALSVADKITWYNFEPESEGITVKNRMAANYSFNFAIKLSEQWQNGAVTAVNTDSGTVFSEWADNKQGGELFEIRVFETDQWDLGKDNEEYTLIYRDNRYAYTFRNISSDSNLSISDDEIKTAFSVLSEAVE